MKYVLGALMLAFTATLYGLTNRFHPAAHELPLTLLDRGPLLPWTAWVYASYPLLFLVAFALEEDAARIRRYLAATFALNVASNAVFLAFPTTIERAGIPPGAAGASLLALVRRLDAPANCFPSLHVSTSYLAAWLGWRRSKPFGAFAFLWATAIAVSTVTTRQHYAADGLAGLGCALLADRIFLARPGATKVARSGCLAARARPYSSGPVRVGRDSRASARPGPPRAASPDRGGPAPRHRRAG